MLLLNGKSVLHQRAGVVATVLLLLAVSSPVAQAGDTAMPGILGPGDAVVTGFSGTVPPPEALPAGADPLDYTFIDPDGSAMQIDRMLPAGPPAGQLIDAPALVSVPARDVGQVFAVTLDDAPAPNIYLGATSSFGIHIVAPGDDGTPRHVKQGMPGAQFMQGQWGTDKGGAPGSIYKVDGKTGAVTLFSSIGTNAGPGLGDVVYDRASRQLFASDLDTGLIYRLDATGLIADTFDHGVSARPARGLAPIADDGSRMDIAIPAFNSEDPSTWGLTPPERRVVGMAVHGGRLYYAVADGPQIWSVGIGLDGAFRGDARWELDVAGLASSNPVTDIAFDSAGRITLAQRGLQRGSFDYTIFAEPKASAVVRYTREMPDDPATPGTWVPVPDEYSIGFRPEQRNTTGGVALGYGYDVNGLLRGGSCNAFLWTTGEALRDDPALAAQLAAGGPATVDGLQGNDSSLVKPANTPPFNSYFTDYDGNFDHPERQGWMGDVEIHQPCTGGSLGYMGIPGYDLPPGWVPPPSGSFNLTLDKEATPQVCLPGELGWLCYYTIRVTNTGSVPYWGPLSVHDWMPAAAPGTLVSFDFQPPWICGATGPVDYQCDLPGVFLLPGDGVDLYVKVEQPLVPSLVASAIGEGLCYAGNGAELLWWGDYGDDDPWDDFDYAQAQIPDQNCLPQGGGTNLSVQKRAVNERCMLQSGNWNCNFLITVTNTGPGVYNGPIAVSETPSVAGVVDYGPQPNPPHWNCVPAGGTSFDCNHAPVSLNPGQSVELWFSVKVPAKEQERAGRCSVENTVRITRAPGGSPGNVNPADDQASAEARTPGPNCEPPAGRRSDLSITKVATGCSASAGALLHACGYQVMVKNEGPDVFAGMVTVHDEPDPIPAANAVFMGPWACTPAATGYDCTLDLSGAPLAPGESRPLNMMMQVKAGSEICEVRNQARIMLPAGGTDANSNAANDATAVIAQAVPLRECQPQQTPKSNLVITKTEQGCSVGSANLTAAINMPSVITCGYQITVRNEGPGDVNAGVTFVDMPLVAGSITMPVIAPGWDCGTVGALAVCSSPTGLASGASSSFTIDVHTNAAQARQNQCRIGNRAWINAPLGAPLNTVAVDDVATAFAAAPASLCTEPQQIKSNICPTERQMPGQGCCPEGGKWNGRKCSGGTTPILPKVCPAGTTGTYPDCRNPNTKSCSPNTTGKYPNCRGKVTKVCPADSVGKYPNCQCPRGTYGSPGNCRTRQKQCPTGTTGKWPNCEVPKACPAGTHGKWPNCQRGVCPQGTVGKWPNCERPRKCPAGTYGEWPNCDKPGGDTKVCPRGTYGEWPNCYKPGGDNNKKKCPKGTYGVYPDCKRISTGTTPNTNCPEGFVFSRKKQTCVPDRKQKLQQPKLQQVPLNISPDLLNQQPQ